jgi:hypothetical protein
MLAAGVLLMHGIAIARSSVDAAPTGGHSLHVRVVGDRVSVRAHNMMLDEVLKEVSQQCSLELVVYGRLDDRTSIAFDALPVTVALKQILRGRSFALRYIRHFPEDNQEGRHPNTLWVFSDKPDDDHLSTEMTAGYSAEAASANIAATGQETTGTGMQDKSRISARQNAGNKLSVDSLAVGLLTGNPADRVDAVDALGDIGDATALQLLEQALGDPEAEVREAAIAAIAGIGGDEAALALTVTLGDEDASLREETVDALGDIGGEMATRLLQQALDDEQPFIRAAAAGHLARISSPGR